MTRILPLWDPGKRSGYWFFDWEHIAPEGYIYFTFKPAKFQVDESGSIFFKEGVELESWNFQSIILAYRRVSLQNFSLLAQLLHQKIFKNFLPKKLPKILVIKSFCKIFQEGVELESWNFAGILFYMPRLNPESFSFLA